MTNADILANLHRRFDHTNLSPDATPEDIQRLCDEAREYDFHSVCVSPIWAPLASRLLADSAVRICTVCDFPGGNNRTELKTIEAIKGALDGAHEIDIVANIGWLASGEFSKARDEIAAVRRELPKDVALKVIIECGRLLPDQWREATMAVVDSGAEFVKSGTGMHSPVTGDQVRVLADTAAGRIKVKAAGGIRTLSQCRDLIAAGADRLGCSASVAIMRELTT